MSRNQSLGELYILNKSTRYRPIFFAGDERTILGGLFVIILQHNKLKGKIAYSLGNSYDQNCLKVCDLKLFT